MMALEQTKYCCFKQISNARQAFIIFLSLKSSKFLNFWRLLFFSFFLQILWTQKQMSYCIIRLEETLSRNNNRNTHICTVLSREKYFNVLLTKVQSEKKNICKGTSTTIFVLFELLKTLLIIRFQYWTSTLTQPPSIHGWHIRISTFQSKQRNVDCSFPEPIEGFPLGF